MFDLMEMKLFVKKQAMSNYYRFIPLKEGIKLFENKSDIIDYFKYLI
jgi:hypothetical protein